MKRKLFLLLILFTGLSVLFAGGKKESKKEQEPVQNSALAEKFYQRDKTIEYHLLLDVTGLTEANLEEFYKNVAAALDPMFEAEPLGKPRWGTYIDSRKGMLDKENIILRVRQGQITVKARAKSPDSLLDLYDTGIKKYEIDCFGDPEYSISVDLKFTNDQFDTSGEWTIGGLFDYIEKASPPLYNQLKPLIKEQASLEIPGKALMYGADLALKKDHPLSSAVEPAISLWFFPPTGKALMEIEYSGYMRDKAYLDLLYSELTEFLKDVKLLAPEQKSKTSSYFDAYFASK